MPVALLYLGILVAAFLLLIVRPQRRQMAAHRALVASLQVGEEVVTSGGIYGTPAFTTTPATITSAGTAQALLAVGGSGGAVANNQGAGILDITYIPDNRLRAGATQSGKVIVTQGGGQ